MNEKKILSITGKEYKEDEITDLVNNIIPGLFNKHNVKTLRIYRHHKIYGQCGNELTGHVIRKEKKGITYESTFNDRKISKERFIESLSSICNTRLDNIGVVKEGML